MIVFARNFITGICLFLIVMTFSIAVAERQRGLYDWK